MLERTGVLRAPWAGVLLALCHSQPPDLGVPRAAEATPLGDLCSRRGSCLSQKPCQRLVSGG